MNPKIRQIIKDNKELLDYQEVLDLIELIEQQEHEIHELNYQNFELNSKIKDSKEKSLISFIQELYSSCHKELEYIENDYKDIEKRDTKMIMNNLINYIKEFAKDNKLKL